MISIPRIHVSTVCMAWVTLLVTHLSSDAIFLELAGSHVLLKLRKFLVSEAVLRLTSSAMMFCFGHFTKLES